PVCANGQTGNPADKRYGGYDCNGDGIFNIQDYAHDPRVSDKNGNGILDPEDLILTFSDGVDDDHNGYVDDIAGWDFYENDNDPQDEVEYGHGTGEADDAVSEAGIGDGMCPNCQFMMLRVGDSFIADVNRFAEAVVYATDNHASVIQEALGTINHTSFGQDALNYAYSHGVMINASEADENAGHHNWPAAYDKTMVVNSIHQASLPPAPAIKPNSYLYFNACTNFGGYTYVSIPSNSCSSEATGRSSGISALAESAARNAVDRGQMTDYIADNGQQMPWPLSTEELRQLWRLGADDIDFSTPCPQHAGCAHPPADVLAPLALPDNYVTTIPLAERYHTVKGWDFFTGYGRANYGRLLRYIGLQNVAGFADKIEGPATLTAQDRIPPEAYIESPRWWRQYGYHGSGQLLQPDDPLMPDQIVIKGDAAANRVTTAGGSFDYILEWAPQAQGPDFIAAAGADMSAPGSQDKTDGPWYVVSEQTGLTHALRNAELGRLSVADVAAKLAGSINPFTPLSDPTSLYQPEKYDIRLRLRVIAHPQNAADTINNEVVMQKQVDVYPAQEAIVRDDLGVRGQPTGGVGSPSFHDINGDGRDELIVQTDDGLIHAYTDVAKGIELPGWPVHSLPLATPDLHGPGTYAAIHNSGDNAYTRGEVHSNYYVSFLVGAPVVADLDNDGTAEVLAADISGHLYAWEPDGSMRPGFPVTVNFDFSRQPICGPGTIPNCDAYATPRHRNIDNRRDYGFFSNPSVGDLDPAYPGLEIVAGASDGHVYMWHADGTPVHGWPVLLRDPAKVASMDPVTDFITYKSNAKQQYGTKVLRTPAIADIDGDGKLDVVTGVNEEYTEPANAGLDPFLDVASLILSPGNGRVYALWNDGTAHPAIGGAPSSANFDASAYKPGWPVPLAMLITELLPTVGSGVNTQPVIFRNNGKVEIAVATAAGPGYILNSDGSSALGNDPTSGKPITLAVTPPGPLSASLDTPSFVGVGGLAAASMDGGTHMTVAGAGVGLRRALSIATIDEHSLARESHLSLWDSRTGLFELNAPIRVNDLQFLNAPIMADVTGSGQASAIQGSAVGDTVVAGLTTLDPLATRYHTGGWTVSSAAVGSGPISGGDGRYLYLATITREGYLRLYKTPVAVDGSSDCIALSQWPEVSHDAQRTGNYNHDGERPYPLRNLTASANADGTVSLSFLATGDSRYCGKADHYEVRVASSAGQPDWRSATPLMQQPAMQVAGGKETLTTPVLAQGQHTLLLRAFDGADTYRDASGHVSGNGSAVAVVPVTVAGSGGSSSGGSSGSGSSSGASSSSGSSSGASSSGGSSGGTSSSGSSSGGTSSSGSSSGASSSSGAGAVGGSIRVDTPSSIGSGNGNTVAAGGFSVDGAGTQALDSVQLQLTHPEVLSALTLTLPDGSQLKISHPDRTPVFNFSPPLPLDGSDHYTLSATLAGVSQASAEKSWSPFNRAWAADAIVARSPLALPAFLLGGLLLLWCLPRRWALGLTFAALLLAGCNDNGATPAGGGALSGVSTTITLTAVNGHDADGKAVGYSGVPALLGIVTHQ
ncbi:MAG: hypothetical protein ACRETM_10390, partial [Stenotrophobium sp.]